MSRRQEAVRPKAEPTDVAFMVRIERDQLASLFGAVAIRPTTVDQRTCEQVIGIPRRDYLRACREGHIPCRVDGKRRVALTNAVEQFWTRGLPLSGGIAVSAPPTTMLRAEKEEEAEPAGAERAARKTDEHELAARLRNKYRLVRTG